MKRTNGGLRVVGDVTELVVDADRFGGRKSNEGFAAHIGT